MTPCALPTCPHAAADPRGTFAKAIYALRGYCSRACWTTATTAHLKMCANETCKRGEGGGRRLFAPRQQTQACCCRSCSNTHWQRTQHWARRGVLQARPVKDDLRTDQIEARLASLAKRRRETRSWLRIDDPWQQRSGSALHQAALVTHGVDIEGAIL